MKRKFTQRHITMCKRIKQGISSDFNKKKLPQKRMFILMMFLFLVTMSVTENSAMGQTTMLNNISFTENHRASSAAEPGNAIDFDGSDDYLFISDNDDAISTVFTLETWVKWEPAASNNVEFICGKDVEQMEIHTGASANSLRFIPTTGVYLDAFGVLPTNAWTHIAAVYDAANAKAKMYVNGEEVVLHNSGNPIGTALKSTVGPFNIGRRGNGTFYFNGAMDEFRIWNRERTQAEIQQDMDSAIISASQTGLVNYYAFNYGIAAATNTGLDSVIDLNAVNNAYLFNFSLDGNTSNWVESYAMVFPIAMAATQVADSGFIANWNIPTVGFIDEYHLELATDSMFTNLIEGYNPKIISSSETSAIVNGLTGITDYYYRIKAEKYSVSGKGMYSNSVNVKTTGFLVSPTLISMADTANSNVSISFSGEVEWTALNDNTWLSMNVISGFGDATIVVTALDNPSATVRTGTIIFSAAGFADQYVTIKQAPKFNEPNNALNFDGINDIVSMPYSDLNSLYPFSIEMWIHWMPDSINCTQYICEHGSERLQVKIVNGKLCFTPNPGMYFNTNVDIPIGIWTHIAISTCSCSADSRLYVNGVEIPLPNMTTVSHMEYYEPFLIGSGRYGAYPFEGSIDEFRIYNYQISHAEVLANMNAPINPTTPGLIHYFKFNKGIAGSDNSGIISLPDLTGAAHATLQGFDLTENTSNWLESYAMVVPEAIAATNISASSFTANWNAPITGEWNNYLLEVSDTLNFFTQIEGSPFEMDSIAVSKNISVLYPNTSYYYRVKANKHTVDGQGSYSNTMTVTTIDSVEIIAIINPANAGVVLGAGKYLHGSSITLVAEAFANYKFTNWTVNGIIISTNDTLELLANFDSTLLANFTINSYSVSASVNPVNSGVIVGTGTYNHGDTVTLVATANNGFSFLNWTANGNPVSTDTTYSFIAVENSVFMANFDVLQLPIAGTLTFSTTDLGSQTRTATANVYDLGDIASTDNLTSLYIEVLDDNINTSSINVMYNGNVQGQMVYTGSNNLWAFSPSAPFNWNVGVNTLTTQFSDNNGNTLDITVNFTYVQKYEVSFAVVNGNGTISASDGTNTLTSPATLEAGTDIAFTATPDADYEVKEWKINNVIVTGNITNTLSIADLSENSAVTVEFELMQSPVAGTLTFSTTDLGIQTRTATNNIYDLGDIASTDNLTGLAIEIIDDNINTANIDVIYNGNVQGQMVYAGSNNLWVFSPSAPFNWNVGVNTLTTQFSDNDGNTLDITVNFTYVQMYRLNFAVINGHGALTAWDGNIQLVSPDTLEIGTAISFEAMPDSGYQVKEWKINGNVVSGNTSNSLEISSLSENTVVNVEFEFAVLVDELNLKNIQVFPNPTNSIININLSTIALSRGETLKINNMVLTDLTGKIILIQSIKTSHNHYNMNLSSLQNGIYFLKMETENEVLIEKIIKK